MTRMITGGPYDHRGVVMPWDVGGRTGNTGLREILFVTCYGTLNGNCMLDEQTRNCKDCEFSICILDHVQQWGVAV